MFKVVFQSIQNWFKGVAHVFVMKILMTNIEDVLFCIDMTVSYFVCQFGFLFSFSPLCSVLKKKINFLPHLLPFQLFMFGMFLKKIHSGTNLIIMIICVPITKSMYLLFCQ